MFIWCYLMEREKGMNKKIGLVLSVSLLISGVLQAGVVFPGGTDAPPPAPTFKAGGVDLGFATNGFYANTTGNNNSLGIEQAVAIQSDGKIVLRGKSDSGNWYVGRLLSDINPVTQGASLGGGGFF